MMDVPEVDIPTVVLPEPYKRPRRIVRWVVAAILLVLLAAGIAARHQILYFIGPGLTLPEPSGPYAVGRVSWDLQSTEREEIFTEASGDFRTIRLDVYYPAHIGAEESPTGRYMHPDIVEGITGLPPFVVGPLTTNWVPGAEPLRDAGPYPVLLFSPGLEGTTSFYTSLLEHLTSHGYIIVALWHPYTNARTIFSDGRVVESVYAANGAMFEGSDEEREVVKQRVAGVWAADMVEALDEVERRNEADALLSGIFDLARVGAFGHSFGGQNAAAAMTLDTRFRAGLNMDGTAVFQPILDDGVAGAFAFVYDEFGPPHEYLEREGITVAQWWTDWTRRNCAQAIRDKASACYLFQMDGVAHEGFSTDLTLLRHIFPFAIGEDMVGTVDGAALLAAQTELIGGFFDATLSGLDAPILSDPSAFHGFVHIGIEGHPTLADGAQ